MTAVPVSVARAAHPAAPVDDWLLTAPWWHWPRQAQPPEHTVPALQKYATTAFATEFAADPQRRLVFDAVTDRSAPPKFDASTFAPLPETEVLGTVTKLYLPTHHRHYLVAVELHCGRPGLPSPDRSAVCEAGFVIRRRRADVPPELKDEARLLQRKLVRAHAQLRVINRRLGVIGGRGRVGLAPITALAEQHAKAAGRVAAARQAVAEWAIARGLERRLEGWVALGVDAAGAVVPLGERPAADVRPLPGLGRWVPVAEVSETLDEATFPLYPLVPDPRDPNHDAAGRSVWFGTVPALSADLEQFDPGLGADAVPVDRPPRLDDMSVYEIRCVVRRHDPHCPRQEGKRDCHGPLTWSAPSEAFRLAPAMDPRGTAHRPATVRLPTTDELADTAGLGYGGIRVQGGDYALGDAEFQICSFSIPLITIVATFVLRIFLPIVVFLFGLWILLALKFCIPPSIKATGGLKAALDAHAPDADIDAGFHAEIDAKLTAAFGAMITSGRDAGLTKPDPSDDSKLSQQPLHTKIAVLRAITLEALRTPTDDLVYEPRVERAEVLGR